MSESAAPTATLIEGGSPTIFVDDLQRAVEFYTDTLGLKLQFRAEEHFAMIDAGRGFQIGLHPPGPRAPRPGTPGSIQVGLTVARPIDEVVSALEAKGVSFQKHEGRVVVNDGPVKLAFFTDPDGNDLYLCEVTV
ncbi:MAG: VOC family protein [Planctomycetota bacterium]|jgi:catechol 2,3-dioxygenase-like lactoylglutathione lyase family enzyme